MNTCAYCGDGKAVGYEAGRPICQHCLSLPEDPIEIAAFNVDSVVFLTLTVQ